MKCRATVLVPDALSYCMIDSPEHLHAVSDYLSNQRMIPICIESEEKLRHWLQYDAYHLDFGPISWTQCVRLHDSLIALGEGGARHSYKKVADSSSCSSSAEPSSDDEQSDSSANAPHRKGRRRKEHRQSRRMVVVTVRSYLPLDTLTNVVTALGIVCIVAGTLRSPDAITALFPYREVLSQLLYFHDASPFNDLESLFDLTAEDVLRGALRAHDSFFADGDGSLSDRDFVASVEHFASLEMGDITWIVPGELCAFSCPDDSQPSKSSAMYAEIFGSRSASKRHLRSSSKNDFFGTVGCVVQLNSARYTRKPLREFGIRHHKLIFDDGAVPPTAVVDEFFSVIDQVQSANEGARPAVAIHCMAGLGRTGTLACFYLIRRYGFTAREAIAWCRLIRPGSVIGPQQQFVVFYEAVEKAKRKASPNVPPQSHSDRGKLRGAEAARPDGDVPGTNVSRRAEKGHDVIRRDHLPAEQQGGKKSTQVGAGVPSTRSQHQSEAPSSSPPLLGRYSADQPSRSRRQNNDLGDDDHCVAYTTATPPVVAEPRTPKRQTQVSSAPTVTTHEEGIHHFESPEGPRPMLQYVVGRRPADSPPTSTRTPQQRRAPASSAMSSPKVLPSRSAHAHRRDERDEVDASVFHVLTGDRNINKSSNHGNDRNDVDRRYRDPFIDDADDDVMSERARGAGHRPPVVVAPILSRSSSTASSTATHRHVRVNVTL